MKKIYSLLFIAAAAATSFPAMAQQLPNAGFENGWSDTNPYVGGGASTNIGQSPADWTIAHVAGYKLFGTLWMGKTDVGEKTNGYNSTSAALLKNTPNSVATSQYVPGYITLGTPWNTANTSGGDKDGGTFGGISFQYRPDAISVQYKREQANGSTEQASVVAYLWSGTVKQANVPVSIGSSPTKVTMEDRDRNILDIETAFGDATLEKSSDFEKIASINHAINGAASDWTYLEIPFEYNSTNAPDKINVIFAAGNYFSTTPENGNTLTVDDVKLVYYSRLSSLSINGTPVDEFDSDKYAYTIDTEMPEESAFAYETLGNSGSASATISLDKTNATATITVTNSNAGGTDKDGQTSHSYTIQFNKSQGGTDTPTPQGNKYKGKLNIKLDAIGLDVTQDDAVYIKDNGDGTCIFTLPNFTLTIPGTDDPANFGDIVVENVTKTTNPDGTITYAGSVKDMLLAGGEIIADVELSGTEDNGHLVMNIPVAWQGLTIDVTFNGNLDTAGISDISVDNNNTDAPIEYFNLDGMHVSGENLTPGIYIRRQGTDVKKILVK